MRPQKTTPDRGPNMMDSVKNANILIVQDTFIKPSVPIKLFVNNSSCCQMMDLLSIFLCDYFTMIFMNIQLQSVNQQVNFDCALQFILFYVSNTFKFI